MPKNFKIGIISGLLLVACAVIWLSTRKDLSVESRMLNARHAASSSEPALPLPAAVPPAMNKTQTARQNTPVSKIAEAPKKPPDKEFILLLRAKRSRIFPNSITVRRPNGGKFLTLTAT